MELVLQITRERLQQKISLPKRTDIPVTEVMRLLGRVCLLEHAVISPTIKIIASNH